MKKILGFLFYGLFFVTMIELLSCCKTGSAIKKDIINKECKDSVINNVRRGEDSCATFDTIIISNDSIKGDNFLNDLTVDQLLTKYWTILYKLD